MSKSARYVSNRPADLSTLNEGSRFEELWYQIQYHAAGSDVSCVLQIDVYKIWIPAYDIIFANKYST